MKEPAELEIQKQIYLLIEREPGLHLTKIADLLDITTPLLLYHVRYMEKHELITLEQEKGFTRCYIKGTIGSEDRKRLSLLRQHMPLKIVLFLLQNPLSKHKDILEKFNISKSTLSYHLKKLVDQKIITIQRIDEEEGYRVIDEDEIIRWLIKYKPSRIAMGVNDTWSGFTVLKKKSAEKKDKSEPQ
jgi:predicted transcriptional regulator